ncbi:expressed unknown protein [Seminavis robusta]|uniref:Uncharacterized protein n=1 Tax=Seminavis robusta TaxID=568900 RepID=A0A9N8EQ41_9STRA|nr:expressed unknown protein [Seminavis robusta]|eukprot:Sro1489_g276980.1 n/a (483) ;mRNA; r:20642-22090
MSNEPTHDRVQKQNGSINNGLDPFIELLENNRKLARKEFTPLRTFILAGRPLHEIERVYTTNRNALTEQTIIEACKYGVSSNVIKFLAQKLEISLTINEFLDACKYVTDSSVVDALKANTNANYLCLGQGRKIDLERVMRFNQILPEVRTLESRCRKWTTEALFEVLRVVFRSKKLRSIRFQSFSPYKLENCNTQVMSSQIQNLVASLSAAQSESQGCGVESVNMTLPEPQTNIDSTLLLFWMVHLPSLQNLTIRSGLFRAQDVDVIQRIVRCGRLRDLKVCGTADDAKGWLPVINALRNNSHLERLLIHDREIGNTATDRLERIIQTSNCTLVQVSNRTCCCVVEPFCECPDPWASLKLKYFLGLNKAGRGRIRKSSENGLSLNEFVAMLASVNEVSKGECMKKRRELAKKNSTMLQYGLLRELPGLWSTVKLARGASRRRIPARFCGRKRKRSDDGLLETDLQAVEAGPTAVVRQLQGNL